MAQAFPWSWAGSYEAAYDEYLRAQSPFREGKRRRMNIVPIVINTFMPCFTFCGIALLLSAQVHHRSPRFVEAACVAFGLVPVAAMYGLVKASRQSYVPTWYKLSMLLFLTAFVAGEAFGWWNYVYYMRPFYQLEQLQSYPNVDVTQVSGKHLQDAGRVYFAAGTKIDFAHSWHFKSGALYCAAPLVGPAGGTTSDFWVVGKDCCSESAADFRCGEFKELKARSGLRLLDDPALPERQFYRLAVHGAEAVFGIKAADPLFFTWVQDPLDIMFKMRDEGWSNLLLANMIFFVWIVLSICLAACRFSFIGRESQPLMDGKQEA